MVTRQQRRERIVELIERNRIDSQEQLQELLLIEGIETTQATVSRDLRDLGIAKGPEGYTLPDLKNRSRAELEELRQALRREVLKSARAGSLLVLHTTTGQASSIARRIEQAGLPQAVGTIADNYTVFVATRSASQAAGLQRLLKDIARR